MRIVGVIPARKGSKGIISKNTNILYGKPLIAHTIEQSLQSKLDNIVVTTDCSIVKSICKDYSVDFIDRPKELAADETLLLPVLQHVITHGYSNYDAVMILQPTSPLRKYHHINNSIDLFNNDPNADSLVSVTKVPHNYTPEKLMSLNGKYLIGNNTIKRRQDVAEYYARNGAAIYITKKELLKDNIMGNSIIPFFMEKIESIDIDDTDDWMIVEALMKHCDK
jgi:CMP-N,N'-diacetyllegionaminic acid synthase